MAQEAATGEQKNLFLFGLASFPALSFFKELTALDFVFLFVAQSAYSF
jgi:hypothetical protein